MQIIIDSPFFLPIASPWPGLVNFTSYILIKSFYSSLSTNTSSKVIAIFVWATVVASSLAWLHLLLPASKAIFHSSPRVIYLKWNLNILWLWLGHWPSSYCSLDKDKNTSRWPSKVCKILALPISPTWPSGFLHFEHTGFLYFPHFLLTWSLCIGSPFCLTWSHPFFLLYPINWT